MDKSAKLWNRMAKRYNATPIRDEATYQAKLEKTREYFTQDSEVLEFGCGTGTTAISHAPYVRHIRAVDSASAMIDIARDKAGKAGVSNITFEVCRFDELEVAPGSVDVVMAHSIMHLLPDIPGVLAKVYAMLKPGGVLVSSTGCVVEANFFLRMLIPPLQVVGIAPYINYFTQQQLESWFTAAGFALDHVWRPNKNAAVFIIGRKPA